MARPTLAQACPTPGPCTHMVLVSILVALAAVAAGEGHTVGVNVQLTHWGAGRVRGSHHAPAPALLAGLPVGAGSDPNLCHQGIPFLPTCMGRGVHPSFGSSPGRPCAYPHFPNKPWTGGGQATRGQATLGKRDQALGEGLSLGGQWGQWYLHSEVRVPPSPCDTQNRTCACKAPGGRSSGLQGPAGQSEPQPLPVWPAPSPWPLSPPSKGS